MDDYISRDEAAKRIDEALSRVFVEPVGESILSKIPAADVRPVRWIPVTESVPEELTDVICCTDDGYITFGWIVKDQRISTTGYMCADEGGFVRDITHWMPLPEPPNCGADMREEAVH